MKKKKNPITKFGQFSGGEKVFTRLKKKLKRFFFPTGPNRQNWKGFGARKTGGGGWKS